MARGFLFSQINPMFKSFPKIPRWSRDLVITEKLDGTNACVVISLPATQDTQAIASAQNTDGTYYNMYAQSRSRLITPCADNYGFAKWVKENAESLFGLGPGHHYGEWWGQGIQRGYGLKEKRFSLFNTHLWTLSRPVCCHVVPVLATGIGDNVVDAALFNLQVNGSVAAPGFTNPEGIMIYHTKGQCYFKKTFDDNAKG